MKTELNLVIQQLFNRPNLDELPVEEIRDFVSKYPYAIAGRFILDQKNRTIHNVEPGKMTASTLYFNNPLWLEFLRSQLDDTANFHYLNQEPQAEIEHAEEELQAEEPIMVVSDSETNLPEDLKQKDFNETYEIQTGPESEEEIERFQEDPEPVSDPEPEQEVLEDTLTKDLVERTEEISADQDSRENSREPLITAEMVEKTLKIAAGNLEAEKNSEGQVKSKAHTEPMVFEPYHSVDYFASQGIRLQASEFGKDRLGQQLKSFTEWIKSMKRLPEAEKQKSMDQFTEQSITRIAQVSLEEKEIHTEAMAEVWVKQGNKDKARSIYEKLSLQNPSKSAYFAAKIEHLNTF